uniref:Uncharacterized protein n=1 Tax=uncultured bacterium contig00053 TaxID=1181537 RepID=A0A806KG66_9BACT|nr:hypothetical protein [uncultured bacterium contig00053]
MMVERIGATSVLNALGGGPEYASNGGGGVSLGLLLHPLRKSINTRMLINQKIFIIKTSKIYY